MALTINTNLFSIDTQKNLNNSQAPLATAMQRLSSGLRINNASDDAAGLAIATRMQRQINGLSQDLNNANNGVSFAQTAEGSMTEMTNDLQRIYELANQSSSYNTSSDRQSMNDEVQQLVSELNRVTSQTSFNGTTFLNQNFTAAFQVGTEVGQTISISTQNVSPNAFGVQTTKTDFSNSNANLDAIASTIASMSLQHLGLQATATLGGVKIAQGASISASLLTNNSNNIISRVNQYTAQTNVTAFSFGNAYIATIAAAAAAATMAAAEAVSANYLTINGIAIGSTGASLVSGQGALAAVMVTAINAKSSQTGVTAVVVGSVETGSSSTYSIALVNTTGAAITVSVATANAGTASGSAAFFATGGSIAAGQNGQVVFSTPLGDTSTTLDSSNTSVSLGFGSSSTTISITGNQSINNLDVSTVGGANLAILAVEQGINTMNNQQAYLGAVVNRFASTVRSIQNISENTQAAYSRIMDADYAAESSNLTKAMITQQAGISVLAQANTLPQQVLSLLPKG